MQVFQQGHAVVVGVGEYLDRRWDAPITATDAEGIADALKSPSISAYPYDQVQLLQNTQATREGITTALQQLAQRATPQDTVIIFFCGHGALGTDGIYYFATHETVFTNGKIQEGTGLSSRNLIEQLRAIKAQKLLFVINACFSGHIGPVLGSSDSLGAPPSAMLSLDVLATGEGRAIITASRPSQYSYYLPGEKNTFFGKALVDGLRGVGVGNSAGYIGLYELYQYLYTSVKRSAAAVNGAQEPMLTIMEGVGAFPVAYYPGAVSANLSGIQQRSPSGLAIDVVPRTIIQAIEQSARILNVQTGNNTVLDQSHNLIDFGKGNKMGSVQIGDVAGRDITKIDVKITSTDVARADTQQELLGLITKLQAEISRLKDVPDGDREDAADELRKAKEAGERGDKNRMVQKLEAAQKILLAIGGSIPGALGLGETIGALLQRAMGV